MRRRELITLLGGTAATWPLVARAQQPAGRVYRVGYLVISSREHQLHLSNAFEEGLRSLGYRVGENVIIKYRFADGQMERLPALARELLDVDIIVTGANPNTIAAMQATSTIPIVMTNGTDPVGAGLVTSLARPGRNVTGLSQDTGDELIIKRLELLKEVLPSLSRVGVLWNPHFKSNRDLLLSVTQAIKRLGITVVPAEARGPDVLEEAFATMAKDKLQAFVVLGVDAVLFNYRDRLAELALKVGLPSAAGFKEMAQAGLLLTYGADARDLFRRSAVFVDKIIKGANPAELPVEQPTKFELVVNLKTARALGLTVPPSVLARADEVIE